MRDSRGEMKKKLQSGLHLAPRSLLLRQSFVLPILYALLMHPRCHTQTGRIGFEMRVPQKGASVKSGIIRCNIQPNQAIFRMTKLAKEEISIQGQERRPRQVV